MTKKQVKSSIIDGLNKAIVNAALVGQSTNTSKTEKIRQASMQVGCRAALFHHAFELGIKIEKKEYLPHVLKDDPLKNFQPNDKGIAKLVEAAELLLSPQTKS